MARPRRATSRGRPARHPRAGARTRRGQPQHGGRIGRAAAEPGGDRDLLLDRDPHRGASQPKRSRKASSAEPPGSAPDTRADDLVAAGCAALEHDLVGQRHRLEDRADLVQPVVAPRSDVKAEVELRGSAGRRASTESLQLARQLDEFAGPERSARSSGGCPICSSDRARRRALLPGRLPPERACERLAAVCERRGTRSATRPVRPGPGGAGERAPSRRSERAEDVARHARRTSTSQESWTITDGMP